MVMKRHILTALVLLLITRSAMIPASLAAQPLPRVATSTAPSESISISAPLLLGGIDVSPASIVFSLAGDLWIVDRNGGQARAITSGPWEDDGPVFSPDGSRVAFTRLDGGGGADVWIVGTTGGTAEQVTFHPKSDVVREWSGDGSSLLMTCGRDGDRLPRLYTGSPAGDPQTALPLPSGYQGSRSPEGARLVYQPYSIPFEASEWRHYRGGATSPLWIVDLATSRVVDRIPRANENLRHPMWHGDRIYYTSDASGVMNLHVYDPRSKRARALTRHRDQGIEFAGLGNDAIAFTRGGRIYLFDLQSQSEREVPVTLRMSSSGRARREALLASFLQDAAPSSEGDRLLLEARGDIFVMDRASGSLRNVTQTPGVAERGPTWSPDGTQVAYFSDASEEYELHLRPVKGPQAARAIRIEDHPTFYRFLDWSPDGRRLAFTDARLRLWLVDVPAGTARVVDRSDYVAQGDYKTSWSPDGAWLAYSKADPQGRRTIHLWSAQTGRSTDLTDSLVHCDHPEFDRTGRYLYFTSSSDARMAPASDIGWGVVSSIWYEPLVSRRLHLVVLRNDEPAPFFAGSFAPNPETDVRKTAPVTRIDLDGIQGRILQLPAPRRDYVDLAAGEPGVLYARTVGWPSAPGATTYVPTPVVRLDLSHPKEEAKILEDVDWFHVGGGGRDVLYRIGSETGWLRIRGDGVVDTLAVPIDSTRHTVDPPVEWRQIVREAWRQMRDTFYDPSLHGHDWAALERETASYLPGITRRRDLNTLLRRMLLRVSVSHLRVGGGDEGEASQAPAHRTGDLGADLEPAGGKLRLTKIYRNGPFAHGNPGLRAPLDAPGLGIKDGDYLLAIEGKPLQAGDDVFRFLVGTTGKPTRITVSGTPDTVGARILTVVPAAGTNALRRFAWAEENRKRVESLSRGRLGYVYVPEYGIGVEDFLSGFLGYAGRVEGLVIDQRFNGGGITPDALIGMLRAEPWYAYQYRYGNDVVVPANTLEGPKVLIVHEQNGSAAETGALMAKITHAATLVGSATFGAGIGAALDQPNLIDGGMISIPNRAAYDPAGTWGIENTGVQPDLLVENDPVSWRAGKDPQLEAAVNTALRGIEAKKRPWRRPKFPRYP
jgi:tricorn protease